MRVQHIALLLTVALALLAGACDSSPGPVAQPPASKAAPEGLDREKYRWFSVTLQVDGLPPSAAFVPVSCPVDFTALLKQLKAEGAVDTHALRLSRVVNGKEIEEPVQFDAGEQPRPKKRLLQPGTPATVSFVAEHPADRTSPLPRVAGELVWAARADAKGSARYLLRFGVPRGGTFVQVPYPPQDLKAFTAKGLATPPRWFPQMQIRPQRAFEGAVHLSADGQLVTSYHIGPLHGRGEPAPGVMRRPFFYPVNGPDGIGLTEVGKPHDPTGSHDHHYSLWIAHHDVSGHSFWGDRAGVIYHKRFDRMDDGAVFARLVQRTVWADRGAEILHERRTWVLHRTPEAFRLLDLEMELTPAGKELVTLGKTSFGPLAVRVAQAMSVFDGGGEIRNERGDRNERGAHLKRARWIDQSGPVAPGKWGGVAMFDHPQNPSHPTGWHCRNDGWAGASLCLDGPVTIRPGEKLRLRYRIHLHRGNADTGEVARRYEEYAARPATKVGQPAPVK